MLENTHDKIMPRAHLIIGQISLGWSGVKEQHNTLSHMQNYTNTHTHI